MSHALRTPPINAVYFLTELPDDREGLEIEEGAWIDVPPNVYAWPEGSRPPETVLCRSREDSKHYKLYRYRFEIEATDWEDTGLFFGGTFSKASWERFAKSLPKVMALHAITNEEGD